MRMIDRKRNIAMNEIKVRGRAILILAEEYERTYKDRTYSADETMANLDDIWRLITENQIRLSKVLQENEL